MVKLLLKMILAKKERRPDPSGSETPAGRAERQVQARARGTPLQPSIHA